MGKEVTGGCARMKKKKSPGLNRDQVPTAQTRLSRGCSAKTLVARREAAVTTTAGTDPPALGERRGRSRAHLGSPQHLRWEGAGPCPQTPNWAGPPSCPAEPLGEVRGAG